MIPEQSLRLLDAIGTSWRNDWSDFDGRTLRAQLNEVDGLVRRECAGEDITPLVDERVRELEEVAW